MITHVTNSGDGHALIFEAAARGEVGRQYPHGLEGREADIEAGAPRPANEQVAGLRTSIERLEALWAASTWDGIGIVAMGAEVPLADLPFFRLREAGDPPRRPAGRVRFRRSAAAVRALLKLR